MPIHCKYCIGCSIVASQREESFELLLSTRHIWYSFWKKRAGITIQDRTESSSFQVDLTVFLVLTEIIGTILVKYHAHKLEAGKDANAKLLQSTYNLSFGWKRNHSKEEENLASTFTSSIQKIGRPNSLIDTAGRPWQGFGNGCYLF
jgi:hypothetical protein